VLDGFATIETAERDYRVVIDPENMTVDIQQTEQLRAAIPTADDDKEHPDPQKGE
jgi:hypothetical protein